MSRYFFTLHDGQVRPDHEGVVLNGPNEARAAAVATAGEMLKDLAGRFWTDPEWQMQVTDEHGTTVCTLRVCGRVGPHYDQDACPDRNGDS